MTEPASSERIAVLIIEDSESDAKLIERELTRAGYEVDARRVVSSDEMRAALRDQSWDIVLADWMVPGFPAPQSLSCLKESGLDLPFICVSGSIGEESAVSLLKDGAADFVLKDRMARLSPAVRRELREAFIRRERRRAEEELKRSQRQFLELVNSIDGIVWEADADTLHFTFVSVQAERLLGFPVEQWLTDPEFWASHVHPDDREWAVAFCSECAAEKNAFEFEYRMIAADRRIIWIREIVTVVQEAGGARRLRGLLVDVSRRKKAESALAARAEQQASIARLGLDALVSNDLQAVHKEAVETAAETLEVDFAFMMEPAPGVDGFRLSASMGFAGLGEDEVTVSADPHSLLQRTFRTNETVISADVRSDDRFSVPAFMSEHGVVSSMTTVVPGRERVLAILGVQCRHRREFSADDLSYLTTVSNLLAHAIERKRARDALRDSENRYRLLVDDARDAIFGIGTNGILLWTNRAAREIAKAQKGDWVGREFTPLVHPDDRGFAVQVFREILGGSRPPPFKLRLQLDDGEERVLEFTLAPLVVDGALVSIIGIGRDLTERQRLEEQLRQAQKMEVVGQLAGGVAHDFSNILQAIVGFVRMAQDEAVPQAQRRKVLDEVINAATRGGDLSRQLLAFSRQQPLSVRDTDIGRWLRTTMRMLRRIIGANTRLELHGEEDLGNVRADETQMGQVLINVCLNARDAMPDGGTISIEAENTKFGNGGEPVPLSGRAGKFVHIRISDTGSGMEPDVRKRVFEPFFTTKEMGRGTGLGLSVVYGIIQQHGGFIQVDSAPGQGTNFDIFLPIVAAKSVPAEIDHQPAGGNDTGVVLLAEDEPAVRRMVEQFLTRSGYEVLVAADGLEAMEIFAANLVRIQIVVLDAVMPRLGGLEAFDRMREVRPDLPAVFCTGYSEDLAVRGHEVPAGARLLQKPYDMDALLQLIRTDLVEH